MSNEDFAAGPAEAAVSEYSVSRRSLLRGLGAMSVGVAAVGGVLGQVKTALAQEVPLATNTGKKVRVGLPLNYGPFNQPWRRGCAAIARTVQERGGELVTVRGEPSKQSEQQSELQLLDQGIDVLVIGIYQTESETAFIVDQARERGIKTVGFAVPVKDSPAVVEDDWGVGVNMGYLVQNALQRQGTIVQTAEDRGFYAGFDKMNDVVELMTKFEPRMTVLPFMSGSVSTSDQISKGRENVLSLLQANPDPASVQAIVSWWWPLAVGASQALRTMPDRDILIASHYFSEQLLGEMASPGSKIRFATDTPWGYMGEKVAELAMRLGRDEEVENIVYRSPINTIRANEAATTLEQLLAEDAAAIALLANYGG
jgi:ABC-type sugar transport system substrate-binding protein